MKPILKSKKNTPIPVKTSLIILVALFVMTAFISIWIAKEKHIPTNTLTLSTTILPPTFSLQGGFFKDAVSLEITHDTPGSQIYYTIDGTAPNRNSKLYNSPVQLKSSEGKSNSISSIPTSPRWKPPLNDVFKGTVVRAVVITNDEQVSKEMAQTYFIHPKGRKRYTLPVVSLIAEVSHFFGFKKGIYVMGKGYEDKDNYIKDDIKLDAPWWDYPANYLRRGQRWERPLQMDFYETHSNSGFSIHAGVRINGNATRGYSQKSLRICFDKAYGKEHLLYDMFPGNGTTRYNKLLLRNSGNDWDRTMFRDALMQALVKNTGLDLQAYAPAIVFLNGEYWGIHNIRERLDENYIANKYQIDKDSVVLIEINEGGNEKHYSDMLRFIKNNNMMLAENYNHATTLMDVANFTDYLIANIYFSNSDWPGNNIKCWRKKTMEYDPQAKPGEDGRWRWMLYDTDYGFGYTGNPGAYKMNMLEKLAQGGDMGILFNNLMKNEEFRISFINRFQYHLNNTFKPMDVLREIDEMQSVIAPEMQEHIERWRLPGSVSQWKRHVEVMREFAVHRPEYQKEQLRELELKYSSAD